jgi:hypothetical protein
VLVHVFYTESVFSKIPEVWLEHADVSSFLFLLPDMVLFEKPRRKCFELIMERGEVVKGPYA